MEGRQSSYSTEDIYNGRFHKRKSKEDDEQLQVILQEKKRMYKKKSFKGALFTIMIATLILITYNIFISQHENVLHVISWRRLANIWKPARGLHVTYVSHSQIDWLDVSTVVKKIVYNKQTIHTVGLLNFNETETFEWKTRMFPDSANHIVLHLDSINKNMTWESLYPNWIDEEQRYHVPECPSLPKLNVPEKMIDVIAIKLPCRNKANWSKDVARLHLQLASAGLATSAKWDYAVHMLFISNCTLIPNLFPCKELVTRQGNVWLYKPNLKVLKEKLQLPIGSCELALPFNPQDTGGDHTGDVRHEAYVTVLHSEDTYICGAITLGQSILMTGTTRDLVALVDETISEYHRNGLEQAGWKIRMIQRIRNPKAKKDKYNAWNYTKFRLWQLTDYVKIIFIDADLLILRNIDFLFQMPEISAIANNGTLFNSGVMGFLNEIFTWWHRLPKQVNFLKFFWSGDNKENKDKKTQLFGATPPILYALHYLGFKPWWCFRDYDCNWDSTVYQQYASDVAHNNWWKLHDSMPSQLQQFCLLSSKQKVKLERFRQRAATANLSDGHWKIEIRDPRKNI
ncbi:Glycosyl transferase, family 8 [Artemisia annua]|uniref:Hexosyltransferase n=1 Tax=Artemisia annua TaxID=35608 RepID=A0A2U1NZC3_ARTAN|nr:Glycosyl transferase, family 8 [Artemisia annua]